MKTTHSTFIALACALTTIVMAPLAAQELQQKLAAAKESAAANQKALRSVPLDRKDRAQRQGRGEEHQGGHVPLRARRQGAEDTGRRAASGRGEARVEGEDCREQDGGDEGGARGGGRARPPIPSTSPRQDAGGHECGHRVDRSGGTRPRIAQVPGLRQGQRRVDADVRLDRQEAPADRRADLAR